MEAIICTLVTLIGAAIGGLIVAMIAFIGDLDYEVDCSIGFEESDLEKKD